MPLRLELVEDRLPRLRSLATGLGPRLSVCSKADERLEVVCGEQMMAGEFGRYRVERRVEPRDRRAGLDRRVREGKWIDDCWIDISSWRLGVCHAGVLRIQGSIPLIYMSSNTSVMTWPGSSKAYGCCLQRKRGLTGRVRRARADKHQEVERMLYSNRRCQVNSAIRRVLISRLHAIITTITDRWKPRLWLPSGTEGL